MQNLIIKIRCVSRKQLFFSCCLVFISMTPECWGQYALENKDCIPSAGADRLYTVSQVYRLPARTVRSRSDGIPQSGAYGSLRKVGIPSSGVQRVNKLVCSQLSTRRMSSARYCPSSNVRIKCLPTNNGPIKLKYWLSISIISCVNQSIAEKIKPPSTTLSFSTNGHPLN